MINSRPTAELIGAGHPTYQCLEGLVDTLRSWLSRAKPGHICSPIEKKGLVPLASPVQIQRILNIRFPPDSEADRDGAPVRLTLLGKSLV
jgi:hypothetical protein